MTTKRIEPPIIGTPAALALATLAMTNGAHTPEDEDTKRLAYQLLALSLLTAAAEVVEHDATTEAWLAAAAAEARSAAREHERL